MISSDPESHKIQQQDNLKIAFRYKNLGSKESNHQHQFGHYYDLSRNMPEEQLKSVDIEYWSGCNISKNGKCFE